MIRTLRHTRSLPSLRQTVTPHPPLPICPSIRGISTNVDIETPRRGRSIATKVDPETPKRGRSIATKAEIEPPKRGRSITTKAEPQKRAKSVTKAMNEINGGRSITTKVIETPKRGRPRKEKRASSSDINLSQTTKETKGIDRNTASKTVPHESKTVPHESKTVPHGDKVDKNPPQINSRGEIQKADQEVKARPESHEKQEGNTEEKLKARDKRFLISFATLSTLWFFKS